MANLMTNEEDKALTIKVQIHVCSKDLSCWHVKNIRKLVRE
jgi:hypothetical protein